MDMQRFLAARKSGKAAITVLVLIPKLCH